MAKVKIYDKLGRRVGRDLEMKRGDLTLVTCDYRNFLGAFNKVDDRKTYQSIYLRPSYELKSSTSTFGGIQIPLVDDGRRKINLGSGRTEVNVGMKDILGKLRQLQFEGEYEIHITWIKKLRAPYIV